MGKSSLYHCTAVMAFVNTAVNVTESLTAFVVLCGLATTPGAITTGS